MILTVQVKPGASKTKVVSWRDEGTVVIALAAPPVDGKANRALIVFLSKQLRVAKSLITIKRGQSGRVKHIELPDGTSLDHLTGS
ncbi:DUF167 domain-containing protein [Candidatus Uhrbacteria bacterium]|jgi:uncharacterized protein|nr:DUF167 domain-containing protein [Candidatus Uhrbacteria bacterium]